MDDLVDWVTRLFDDCCARAPFGAVLELDRAQPPLVATVSPADMPAGYVTLDRDDIGGRLDFARRLQAFLDVVLDRPVPSCPTHNLGLSLTRVGDEVVWCSATPAFAARRFRRSVTVKQIRHRDESRPDRIGMAQATAAEDAVGHGKDHLAGPSSSPATSVSARLCRTVCALARAG